jgi:hypothetical protein
MIGDAALLSTRGFRDSFRRYCGCGSLSSFRVADDSLGIDADQNVDSG